MIKTNFIFSLLFTLVFFVAFSQDEKQESATPSLTGTIESQFEYAIQKSNNFQEYKVVKLATLNRLKANTIDSIARYQKEISIFNQQLSKQQSIINESQKQLEKRNEELAVLQSAQDNIDFFGVPISKTNYNVLMWSIVLVLGLLLFFMLFRVQSAASYSRQAKETYSILEGEFEDFKRRAMEKEQKLGRQLVDEINKHKKPTKK